MSPGSSIVLYLMIGVGVAGALFVRSGARGVGGAFRLCSAGLFWPLFVPVLLAPRPGANSGEPADGVTAGSAALDPLDREISRVEAELDRALQTLDGWAEGVLPWEGSRFEELKHAWRVQADRIRELAVLLAASGDEPSARAADAALSTGSPVAETRKHQSECARRENIERLREVHRRMQDDLLGNLAWVRELVTLIHLARYTGAPASRAEELVGQIAAAVEGLSRVSDWQSSNEPAGSARA